MADFIQPRTLKGFRDYPPALMMPREHLMEQARRVYRSYGFAPIDTPALEYAEILRGKAGEESDKLIYSFQDHGGRDVALRFDLTVPFARFAAQYIGKLGTPFKRYHMGPVWRGENTGHGRYREFQQCDFDTIGTTSSTSDIEVALVIHDLMVALGFERFEIRINHRQVLNGVLDRFGLLDRAVPILRALDKIGKVDRDGVKAELMDASPNRPGLKEREAEQILHIATAFKGMKNDAIIAALRSHVGTAGPASEGLQRLDELLTVTREVGIPPERIVLDPSICRGLDYYTGIIFETTLSDKPDIGSVCSGGRYDNLASLYSKQVLPGVGASLGLDRLLAAMEELNLVPKTSTPAPVLVVHFAPEHAGAYQRMARHLRTEGIGVEVYPEAKKLGPQLKYAESRGFRVALIAGPDEFAQGMWQIKDLARREQITVPATEVVAAVRKVLSAT
jgi:histidyl-tRNA synthetase